MILYEHQAKLKHAIMASGHDRVLGVLPTGGGKTAIMASIFADHKGASVAIAHRNELVGQISNTLANYSIQHRVIAQDALIKWLIHHQIKEFGNSFVNHRSDIAVASVDTLIRHRDTLSAWAARVTLWQTDEGHHVQPSNKWGRALDMFKRARGIGWTATPERADNKPLSTVYQGYVEGPQMRPLIDAGYLTDYQIFAPPESIDLTGISITAGGDLNQADLRTAAHKSKIVGNSVEHYLKIARGKLGVTFVVDVETAELTAAAYRDAGISAVVITANTPIHERTKLIATFKRREILQIVNVDILGEGFDCPAIEVCSMDRPTMSYPLYKQQFGRALRTLPGKTHGIILDHAGNVHRHGLPDTPRLINLDGRTRQQRAERQPGVRICQQCFFVFEPWIKYCPQCGWSRVPAQRTGPEHVDGDLVELTPDVLIKMRSEADKLMRDYQRPHDAKGRAIYNNHITRKQTQEKLREAIAYYGGWVQEIRGLDKSTGHRLFFHEFGIDVLSAQSLGAKDAEQLTARIHDKLARGN
jgi:superfamily II DNA or RNA helicase